MKKLLFILFLIAAAGGLSFAQQNSAPQKFALVIGNADYAGIAKLRNPVNDANSVAAALESLGFSVEKLLNGDLDKMESAAERLIKRLATAKNSYGFLFFAGHGAQAGRDNYLIPVDAANIRSENHLRQRAVSVQTLLDNMTAAGNELNMIVLDACRENPFSWARPGIRGLTEMHTPAGSIVMYAASSGSIADDGTGSNSLFTGQLLTKLKTPGLSVRDVFNKTEEEVLRVSGGKQHPELSMRFFGASTAYLGQRPAGNTPAQPAPAVSTPAQPASSTNTPVQPATNTPAQPAPAPSTPVQPAAVANTPVQPAPAANTPARPAPATNTPSRPVSLPNNPDFEMNSTVLVKYKGNASSVTIPTGVTAIWDNAFIGKSVMSVTIPNSVTSIGEYAFNKNQLAGVTIPNSVTNIGKWAFRDNRLTSVTIGDSVNIIGEHAFDGNRLTGVTIPNSVTSIGDYAFNDNILTRVTIGGGVTSIGEYAFNNNKLTGVTIPAGVTVIGRNAFGNCPNLASIEVAPDNASFSSEDGVLFNKDKTMLIQYPNGKRDTYSIPSGVAAIRGEAFLGCQLTSVTIPNGVTSIGDSAFAENRLTSVTIPNSVTSIGDWAFRDNKLTGVTIPNGVTSIGASAFSKNQITSVTIPNSVTSIGDWAFRDNKLTSISIGANVAIAKTAFSIWNKGSDESTGFMEAYEKNGKKAGTYTYNDRTRKWNYQAR